MHKHYADQIFTNGDLIPVMTWPNGKAWFKISETIPNGCVFFHKSTQFELSSKKINPVNLPKSPYASLGGMDKLIQKIREMIEIPMWHPEIFEEIGIEAPNGILLYGPPGTGKNSSYQSNC